MRRNLTSRTRWANTPGFLPGLFLNALVALSTANAQASVSSVPTPENLWEIYQAEVETSPCLEPRLVEEGPPRVGLENISRAPWNEIPFRVFGRVWPSAGASRSFLLDLIHDSPFAEDRIRAMKVLGSLGPGGAADQAVLSRVLERSNIGLDSGERPDPEGQESTPFRLPEPVRYEEYIQCMETMVMTDLEHESLVPRLLRKIKRGDAEEAMWALGLLGRMGPRAREALPVILDFAIGSNLDFLIASSSTIVRIDPSLVEALPAIIRAFESPRPLTRQRACELVGLYSSTLREKPTDLLDALTLSMSDPERSVRGAAVWALGQTGSIKTTFSLPFLQTLERVLSDSDPAIRSAALRTLAQVAPRSERTILALLERLKDPTLPVRIQAVRLLGCLATSEDVVKNRLVRYLEDKTLGPFAAASLARSGGTPDLWTAIAENRPGIVENAVHGISSLAALPDQVETLWRAGLGWTSEHLGRPTGTGPVPDVTRVCQTLQSFLDRDEPEDRISGLRALEVLGPSARPLLPKIIEMLKDPVARVARQVTRTLGIVGVGAEQTIQKLIRMAEDSDSTPERLRELAQRSLARIGPSILPQIEGEAKSAGAETWIPRILGLMGPGVIDPLVAMIHSQDPAVKRLGLRSIEQVGSDSLQGILRALDEDPAGLRETLSKTLIGITGSVLDDGVVVHLAQTVIRHLKGSSDEYRRHVSEILDRLGPLAIWQLDDGLITPEGLLDPNRVHVLTQIRENTHVFVPRLAILIRTGPPKLAQAATRVLLQTPLDALGVFSRSEVSGLIDLFRSANDDVLKRKILKTLTAMGSEALEATPLLIRLLEDKPWQLMALEVLRSIGPAAYPSISAVTRGLSDERTRQAALETLRAMGPLASSAAASVLDICIKDSSNHVARDCLKEFGSGLLGAWPDLEPFLLSGVRTVAMQALERSGGIAAWRMSQITRSHVAKGTPEFNDLLNIMSDAGPAGAPGIPILLPLLDREESVGANAAVAQQVMMAKVPIVRVLGRMGAAAWPAVDALAALLGPTPRQKYWFTELSMQVARTLALLGPVAAPSVPHLIEVLDDRSGVFDGADLRIEAARTLGAIGPGALRAVPILLQSFEDGDAALRSEAIRSVALIDPENPKLHAALEDFLEDPDLRVRQGACIAISVLARTLSRPAPESRFDWGDPDSGVVILGDDIVPSPIELLDILFERLITAVTGEDQRSFQSALSAAGAVALPFLIGQLRSLTPELRPRIFEILVDSGLRHPSSVILMTQLFETGDEALMIEVAQNLNRLAAANPLLVSETLLPLLNHRSLDLVLEALKAMAREIPVRGFLSETDLASYLPTLSALLSQGSTQMRQLVTLILGRVPPPLLIPFAINLIPGLGRAVLDSNVGVRRAAVKTLGRLLLARPGESLATEIKSSLISTEGDDDPVVKSRRSYFLEAFEDHQ